jgi:hypothetical protein
MHCLTNVLVDFFRNNFSLEKQPYCDPTPNTAKQWEWIFSQGVKGLKYNVSQTFFWPGNPNTCTFYVSTVLTSMFIREEGVYYSLQGTIGKSSLWLFKVTYTKWALIRHCWFTLLCMCVCVCVRACTRVHAGTLSCSVVDTLSESMEWYPNSWAIKCSGSSVISFSRIY